MAEDVQKYNFKTAVSTAKYRRNMMNMAEDAKIHLEHQQWMVNTDISLEFGWFGTKMSNASNYFLIGETSKGFEQSQLELETTS